MNRQLAKAVVWAFQIDEPEMLRKRFAAFSEGDWASTNHWLHTSGMALYFLDRTTRLGIEDAMPAALVHELSRNLTENRARTADLLEEFARLNAGLMRAGVSYLNLKGFSLAPAAFADPAFRYQQDLDFLVARRDLDRCARVLEAHGYKPRRGFSDTLEFSAGIPAKTTMRDLYRVRPVRNVEVHPVSEAEEARAQYGGDRISRIQLQSWKGVEFPALSDADKLLSQASHLFQHFQSEWTRTSWLLEYANAARAHQDDAALWREANAAVNAAPETRIGVALATLVMLETFGAAVPCGFADQTIHLLPPEVRLWADRYGSELVFTDHPGSKLYLLLCDVLESNQPAWRQTRRHRLLPLHPPPRVMQRTGTGLWKQWTAALAQAGFSGRRLKFHMTEGLRYKRESARWRRLVAAAEMECKEA